ncbi:MAG: hypothetical protein K5633_04735 [Paludibacteraceae bacterium]|nr:hypothetical protein [Paludibacteraceae bacterium]
MKKIIGMAVLVLAGTLLSACVSSGPKYRKNTGYSSHETSVVAKSNRSYCH